MKSCFHIIVALCTRLFPLSVLVMLLSSGVVNADSPPTPESNNESVAYTVQDRAGSSATQNSPNVSISHAVGGGVVSYWVLAFLLAANIAGIVYMRRWSATIDSRADKE